MSRIAECLRQPANGRRNGFIPFVTAGDPDLATSLEIIKALARTGADVIELGVPFTDPMADGPTIQRSSQRALAEGATLPKVFDLITEFRREFDTPVVLFSYLNPLLRSGIDAVCRAAEACRLDGILLTDAAGFEAADIGMRLRSSGVDLISLVAPTTTDERLREILKTSSGFVYAVSRAGVTGAQDRVESAARDLVRKTRQFTDLPIAVGFGISTREQVAEVWEFADAAVVGSAIVAVVEKNAASGDAAKAVEAFTRSLLPQIANQTPEG